MCVKSLVIIAQHSVIYCTSCVTNCYGNKIISIHVAATWYLQIWNMSHLTGEDEMTQIDQIKVTK